MLIKRLSCKHCSSVLNMLNGLNITQQHCDIGSYAGIPVLIGEQVGRER